MSTVLGAVVVIGGLVALITSVGFTAEPRTGEAPMGVTGWSVFGLGVMVSVVAFFGITRRDGHAAALVAVGMSFMTGLGTGLVAAMGSNPHPLAAATAVISSMVFIGSWAFLIRNQLSGGPSRNPLAALVPSSSIVEIDGVQFAVDTGPIAGGVVARVRLQNCFDAPREFEFGLEGPREGLLFAVAATTTLSPLALVQLDVPILVLGPLATKVEIIARPSVRGAGGTRVRRWRAKAYEQAVTGSAQLGWLALGVLRWGGGVRFRFGPTSASNQFAENAATPTVTDLSNAPGLRSLRTA
jgi:hypothetical protein